MNAPKPPQAWSVGRSDATTVIPKVLAPQAATGPVMETRAAEPPRQDGPDLMTPIPGAPANTPESWLGVQAPDPRPGNYYVSAVDGPRYWMIAGPFSTHAKALAMVDEAREKAEKKDPRAIWMAWGTCRTEVGDARKTPMGTLESDAKDQPTGEDYDRAGLAQWEKNNLGQPTDKAHKKAKQGREIAQRLLAEKPDDRALKHAYWMSVEAENASHRANESGTAEAHQEAYRKNRAAGSAHREVGDRSDASMSHAIATDHHLEALRKVQKQAQVGDGKSQEEPHRPEDTLDQPIPDSIPPSEARVPIRDNQGRNLEAIKRHMAEEMVRSEISRDHAHRVFEEKIAVIPLADWTEVEGIKVLRSGHSRFVAVPRNGRNNAAHFDVIDTVAKEHVTTLARDEVRNWLWRAAENENDQGIPRPIGLERKRIHGEPVPLWERLSLQPVPPVPCPFAAGDRVIYTNDYGLKFDMDVIGFSKDASFYGRFIHLARHGRDVNGSAWWYPHAPHELVHYTALETP